MLKRHEIVRTDFCSLIWTTVITKIWISWGICMLKQHIGVILWNQNQWVCRGLQTRKDWTCFHMYYKFSLSLFFSIYIGLLSLQNCHTAKDDLRYRTGVMHWSIKPFLPGTQGSPVTTVPSLELFYLLSPLSMLHLNLKGSSAVLALNTFSSQ